MATTWSDGMLLTPLGSVSVYQCGSCRDYNDPNHWSWSWDGFAKHVTCGFATEAAAMDAAEDWLFEKGHDVARAAKEAYEERTAIDSVSK
jgi:hypothetical protein